MARVLYVWELGGGLGHLTTALPLANAYRALGHEFSLAVRDIAAAGTVFPTGMYPIYQAPVWQAISTTRLIRPISYAEILLNHGYGDPDILASMARAWIALFQFNRPDLVVLDFSPTAMLAANILGLRHCTIGHGFFLPPRMTPVPAFVPHADQNRLVQSEENLLESINGARAKFGRAPLARFADFFDTDLDVLTTWPEIEHYPQRKNAKYWGPILMHGIGKLPFWRCKTKYRVFVYMSGDHPDVETVLRALGRNDVEALAYCPGLSTSLARQCEHERIQFLTEIYDVACVLNETDALICQGNFGVAWEALLAGKPMLCLPSHMEQWIAAQGLAKLGVAINTASGASVELMSSTIISLLSRPGFRATAARVACQYRGHSVESQSKRLVEMTIALLHKRVETHAQNAGRVCAINNVVKC